ncbi:hypothetical protein [Sorangium sp. So ce1099]|uniref:hypothetical protein n=1 Tax=Sorangium sp. So ce1099 TaxID=3133331 RepID=UPI003F639A27
MDDVLVPEGLADREEQRLGPEGFPRGRQRRGADPDGVRRAAAPSAGVRRARLDDDSGARRRPVAPVAPLEIAEQARPRVAGVP